MKRAHYLLKGVVYRATLTNEGVRIESRDACGVYEKQTDLPIDKLLEVAGKDTCTDENRHVLRTLHSDLCD